jgi:CopG family nickel-responsive transcriptional regulator
MRRFGVSLEPELLERLDGLVQAHRLPSRSEAIRHLVREQAAHDEWASGQDAAACVVLVYDHHRRDLVTRLVELQHEQRSLILASQHVHLDERLCLESVLLRGPAHRLQALADALCALKGVHQGQLVRSATI